LIPGVTTGATPSVVILTAMITPTILILAAASLVGATTNRLERTMEAMHELAEAFDSHMDYEQDRHALNDEQISLMAQVERTSKRVRLMQYTVALLHIAIACFVLTGVTLGIEAASGLKLGLTPVAFGLVGALLLFLGIATLVRDAVIAVQATREEALFTLRMTEYRAAQFRRTPTRTKEPVSWS
jgi:hypothetical protein